MQHHALLFQLFKMRSISLSIGMLSCNNPPEWPALVYLGTVCQSFPMPSQVLETTILFSTFMRLIFFLMRVHVCLCWGAGMCCGVHMEVRGQFA